MASTVLLTYESHQIRGGMKQKGGRKLSQRCVVEAVDLPHMAETVGESDGRRSSLPPPPPVMSRTHSFAGSAKPCSPTASEDSCSLKRKSAAAAADMNGKAPTVRETIDLQDITRSDRKQLRKRLKLELAQVQSMCMRIEAREAQIKGQYAALQESQCSLNIPPVAATGAAPELLPPPSLNTLTNGSSCSSKERRMSKGNQLYSNSEYLSVGEKLSLVEKTRPWSSSSLKRSASGKSSPDPDPKRPRMADLAAQEKKMNELMKQCGLILKRLMNHKFSWVFGEPVDVVKLKLHDYFAIIKKPMDLGTIKKRLDGEHYNHPQEFADDVRLTFANAMKYNPAGHDVHVMAGSLKKIFEERWKPVQAKLEELDPIDINNSSMHWHEPQIVVSNGPIAPLDITPKSFKKKTANLLFSPAMKAPTASIASTPMKPSSSATKASLAMKPLSATKSLSASKSLPASKPLSASKPLPASKPLSASKPLPASKPSSVMKPSSAMNLSTATKSSTETKPAQSKPALSKWPAMTYEEKRELSRNLESLPVDKADRLVQIIRSRETNLRQTDDDEIEVDIDLFDNETLWELHQFVSECLDAIKKTTKLECRDLQRTESQNGGATAALKSRGECDGGDEDVDICDDMLPSTSCPKVVVEKDGEGGGGSRHISSSLSSSDSDSSSSDSDSASSSCSASDREDAVESVGAAKLSPKETVGPGTLLRESRANPISKTGAQREDATVEQQVSPEKRLRAALLKNRFADTILKAQEKTLPLTSKGDARDPQKLRKDSEELERRKREKARLQAEADAAKQARKAADAEAAAEARRKRELEREAARLALQKMEKTVDIDENCEILKDLEMLRSAAVPSLEHLASSGDEASPVRSPDRLSAFALQQGGNPLEQLGLFMKPDDDEDDLPVQQDSIPPDGDEEEGEIEDLTTRT